MSSGPDLQLVSGAFFSKTVPRNKRYLLKYFRSETSLVFVSYFVAVRDHANFVDHTGFRVSQRWLRQLRLRIEKLEEAYDKARATHDSSTVAEIESGKYKS